MSEESELRGPHPTGDGKQGEAEYPAPHLVQTFGGGVEVKWVEDSSMSMHGPLIYFVEFFKETKIWVRIPGQTDHRFLFESDHRFSWKPITDS